MDTKNFKYIPQCPIWDDILIAFFETEQGSELRRKVTELREAGVVYPEPKNLFRAFKLCPADKVKVVILGQDPYHNGVADGLAFSSSNSMNRPPSLKNIFAEIMRTEYAQGLEDSYVFKSNSLAPWAEQGVLLLNTCLTVEKGKAGSHKKLGWQTLIESVLWELNTIDRPITFMLWGNEAQDLGKELLNNPKHLILTGYHPQAQNYPGGDTKMFIGNNHFKTCGEFFVRQNPQILGINWRTI